MWMDLRDGSVSDPRGWDGSPRVGRTEKREERVVVALGLAPYREERRGEAARMKTFVVIGARTVAGGIAAGDAGGGGMRSEEAEDGEVEGKK